MGIKEKIGKLVKDKTYKGYLFLEQEYLEKELLTKTKSEYHNGKIIAMAGTQSKHHQIVSNLL